MAKNIATNHATDLATPPTCPPMSPHRCPHCRRPCCRRRPRLLSLPSSPVVVVVLAISSSATFGWLLSVSPAIVSRQCLCRICFSPAMSWSKALKMLQWHSILSHGETSCHPPFCTVSSRVTLLEQQWPIGEGSGGLWYYYDIVVIIVLEAPDVGAVDHHPWNRRGPWWKSQWEEGGGGVQGGGWQWQMISAGQLFLGEVTQEISRVIEISRKVRKPSEKIKIIFNQITALDPV